MEQEQQHTYEVKIFGSLYKIKGDRSKEYTEHLASYVDKKMREVANNTPNISSIKIAVLAALNIANDLFEIKDEYGNKDLRLTSRFQCLLSKIDKEIGTK